MTTIAVLNDGTTKKMNFFISSVLHLGILISSGYFISNYFVKFNGNAFCVQCDTVKLTYEEKIHFSAAYK